MKIRTGFVTNSSSTNFLIISKAELTAELLFSKLGFEEDGPIAGMGWDLCRNIIQGINDYVDNDSFNDTYIRERIQNECGEKAAIEYDKMKSDKCFIYFGSTSSDEDEATIFFTLDSFEIEENEFYLNGRECLW